MLNQPVKLFKHQLEIIKYREQADYSKTAKKNPIDRNGLPTKCAICDCFNHWQKQCPDKNKVEHKTCIADEIVLHQNDYDSPDELKFLMAESWSSALLDCDANILWKDLTRSVHPKS